MSDALPLRLEDWEAAAREVLPRDVYDYYAGGAEDEITLADNRAAWREWHFRPRVLVDVTSVDPSIDLLGQRLSHPILVAPTAFQRLAHPDGETATARAARRSGTLLVASTLATTRVEDVAAAAPGPFWLQVYVFRDRELTSDLVARAVAAGATAVCLTVTVPVQGRRERDIHNHFHLPSGIEMANFAGYRQAAIAERDDASGLEHFIRNEFDASLTWRDLEWLVGVANVPVLVKGVMTADDARIAEDNGAAGVIVSNHGGRQLDGAEPTARALVPVAEAVGDRTAVLVDGGIRRGSDVAKALALGAHAVLIGRPVLWGLVLAGEDGVFTALEHLREELVRTMALLGRVEVSHLGEECLAATS
jgi:4-hydroxymandelate oxidase